VSAPAHGRWADRLLERRHGGDQTALERALRALGPVRDRVLDSASSGEGEAVLDLGCGAGLIAFGAVRQHFAREAGARSAIPRSEGMTKPVEQVHDVVIRFAGDSGDGMQLTGGRFTSETALLGNDLSTLPDFPAEIRAPAGSLPGVSGFQIHFSDRDILTPGDAPDVLVAMNPAALKTNLGDLPTGGMLIVNTDAFTDRNLDKAGYTSNPLEDGTLADYHVHAVGLTTLTQEAVKEAGVSKREAERSKNMFALGLMSWLYHRPTEGTIAFLEGKFSGRPEIAEANIRAFKAGYNYGETSEDFAVSYEVAPARLPPGTYRNITGNQALALGLVAASVQSGLPLFLGAYPITPASGILEELARHKHLRIRTFQAEDEIAAAGAALGASFGGALGVCTSSGPGVVLKMETVGLAITLELPLLIVDVQRAGPATGMPTKPEQADLLLTMFGRNAESPVPVLAASTPGGCFHAAIEAVGIALRYRTPVFLLSDAYLANGAEPWRIPDVSGLPDISVEFAQLPNDDDRFSPYLRDPETLARPWAVPGTPGLEHRIGGLEKHDVSGNVSYDPENHDAMVRLRARKVAGIASELPELEVDHQEGAELLVLGWGGTYGPITAAVRRVRAGGGKVAQAHLRHLNPFPRNTGDVLRSYDRVLIPEMNLGQLLKLLRAEFLVDAVGYNRVRGLPFTSAELAEAIEGMA
jgi:2-oxoglutarate ferredoxin oxidoreductase subunit alpha